MTMIDLSKYGCWEMKGAFYPDTWVPCPNFSDVVSRGLADGSFSSRTVGRYQIFTSVYTGEDLFRCF